jgi:hypothetical protein
MEVSIIRDLEEHDLAAAEGVEQAQSHSRDHRTYETPKEHFRRKEIPSDVSM